jgi:methylglyoxal synthase
MSMRSSFTLVLVAHDRKKESLADFVAEHRRALGRFHLVATRGTGALIARRTGLVVHTLDHGHLGGDQQIGALAEQNRVQAAIFFRDPEAEPHEPDFGGLLRVCDEQEIPLATNRSTAEALIYFLESSPDRALVAARPWGFVLPGVEAQPVG